MRPVLVGVDWGTSSFRATLIGNGGNELARVETADGIMTVPAGRFPDVLARGRDRLGAAAASLPILISGMAGSRQGWVEVPYLSCPAGLSDVAQALARAPAANASDVRIVPGLMTRDPDGEPDVMRGEEVQVLGALEVLDIADGLFVLPGTHSKWVMVEDGRITSFTTFMTGEVFAALKDHTILGRLMPPPSAEAKPALKADAFRQGVGRARAVAGEPPGVLLHQVFMARTRALTGELPPGDIAEYLSGLLIGAELVAAQAFGAQGSIAIGAEALVARYQLAADVLDMDCSPAPAGVTTAGLYTLAQASGMIQGN